MKKVKKDYSQYEDLGKFEMSGKEADNILEMIEQADKEIEEKEARISFRWGRKQLDLVKKAANAIGVPYQTYIKLVVYKSSVDDLSKVPRI